jgi:hypothetical protein
MIAHFEFQPGLGGHFFLRLLLYRWGLAEKPKPNSYWNEYHFPIVLWELKDFLRLQFQITEGEDWFIKDDVPKLREFNQTLFENYLKDFRITEQRNDKHFFMLEHSIWPDLNKTMNKVKGYDCPNISITTKNIDTAIFCRRIRDVKTLLKKHYGIMSKENSKLREGPIWKAEGVNHWDIGAEELMPVPKSKVEELKYIIDLEIKHADIILDYDSLINRDISCFREVDNYYKLEPKVPDSVIADIIQEYNEKNKELLVDKRK